MSANYMIRPPLRTRSHACSPISPLDMPTAPTHTHSHAHSPTHSYPTCPNYTCASFTTLSTMRIHPLTHPLTRMHTHTHTHMPICMPNCTPTCTPTRMLTHASACSPTPTRTLTCTKVTRTSTVRSHARSHFTCILTRMPNY
ncbi:hypothetical protein BOTBODRAFT_352793 [Botryobasidium botryosum FD-172 SS1]|uniref:Uncharacterized protein n=1 Tax=Botryobasidium botryosum (strain FD-172 SS1) TaxID=930990 RepID=A0A067MQN5_BOTB1|nr:hypothetical protein BOTBODRAFT_352793 [Botryobasidium botryosum FD-172 SS1]